MSNMGHSDCFNEKALAHLWKKAQRGGRSLEHSKEVGHKKKQLVRLSLPLVPDRTLKYGFSEKIVGTLSHSTSTVQFFYNPIFKI